MRRARDAERVDRIKNALIATGTDALLCTLPSNVLMISGYWPVVGTAIAIATREGMIAVVAPEDEIELALEGWADDVRTFSPASLNHLQTIRQAVIPALAPLQQILGFCLGTRIGIEAGPSVEPCGYAGKFTYGTLIPELVAAAFPFAVAVDASETLAQLRSSLTSGEIESVRAACAVARKAFCDTVREMSSGVRECELAALLRSKLACGDHAARVDGFAYCMSGPNSSKAYAAYQRSTLRPLSNGDYVLLHCNSFYGGFWTDITRTYSLGEPAPQNAAIMNAVLAASREACRRAGPGIRSSAVDFAARQTLAARGFGDHFKHPTGHGVGFAAIDHGARPRIHPLSDEVLEPGMVFNIEPAVYVDNLGGMRQCDMVVVTEAGVEALTPFHDKAEDLIVG